LFNRLLNTSSLDGVDWHASPVPDTPPSENVQPHVIEQIRLMGGINFTTWPDLKWSRANAHAAVLQSRLGEWHASAPVSIDSVLREDRLGFDLVARVPNGMPKHEWSLDLGDALHNLRSALDAVAWGMAHFNGAEPSRPKAVQFPVCAEEKQWKKALHDWVSEIPLDFQERLRIIQPFILEPAAGVSLLSMLHDLDIQDKHREFLTVSIDLNQINLGGFFKYEEAGTSAMPRVDMLPDAEFNDGVVLGTIYTGAPVRPDGQLTLRPATKLQLSYRGEIFDAIQILSQLLSGTRYFLDILLFGLPTPNEAGWSPIGVGPAHV